MRRNPITIAAIAGLAAAASTAAAQDLLLELVQVEDISVLSSEDTSFFIGSNPTAIAYDGRSLFVAGFNNTPDTANIQIAQIVDFLDQPNRSFFTVANSAFDAPGFWSYSGLDWDPNGGLLASIDAFDGRPGQFAVYVSQGVSYNVSVTSAAGRGRADPAWDNGPDGMGFPISTGTGPVAAVFDNDTTAFSGVGFSTVGGAGPLGLDATNGLAPVYYVYEEGCTFGGACAPEPGVRGPRFIPSSGDTTGTLWRSLDMKGTTVAARADNDLIIAQRDMNNETIGEPVRVEMGSHPFMVQQNLAILDNQQCGDTYIIWNDRPDQTGTFGCTGSPRSQMLLQNTDGTPATYDFVDSSGTPVDFTALSVSGVAGTVDANTGNCAYNYFWDSAEQLLFISDFDNRLVYVFTPSCGTGGCNGADVAEPFGTLDIDDVLAFLNGFASGDLSIADLDPNGTLNIDDVLAFLGEFAAGCP